MLKIIPFIIIDLLFFILIARDHITSTRWGKRTIAACNILVSLATYYLLARILLYRGEFAGNENISRSMYLFFLVSAFWVPKFLMILFLYPSHWLSRRHFVASKTLKYAVFILASIFLVPMTFGLLIGRYNFKVERVSLFYDGLPEQLDGFKIVHITDLHLSSFHNREEKLSKAVAVVNRLEPDIVINTGDFVTIAYNEMEPFTSILGSIRSVYGNYAITGNHDEGTYHPYFSSEDIEHNYMRIVDLIGQSGQVNITDSVVDIDVSGAVIRLTGNRTRGSIPDITYSDATELLAEGEGASFRIHLAHDPNYWRSHVTGKYNIDLTLSGHTHGMQMGIILGNFKWSPAKYIYPEWYGLFEENGYYLYVNRGLGTIGIPVRIGMSPEITLITIRKGSRD